MLNFAIQTALDAGRVLTEKFGRALQITNKGDIDLVTEADIASERLIVERIRSYHPRHAILTEEAGDVLEAGGADAEYKWIIDPLDGTTNYAHGYPIFCVSVALEHLGRVVVGVVYDPTRDELFAAERGEGATLNGRRIRVSDTSELNRALLCTGFPYDVRERGDFARYFHNFIMQAQSVRRDGSAALDLAYVAAGRFEGFYEEGLRPWDVAAGMLLVEEAGGRVTHYDGSPFRIYTPPIIASNGLVHDAMLRVLAD
ncbi:MAG: monophosphatase [Acidobacteriota bacterium]|jgi:myo-inositol-1(or 4)-monophosphatase|nr:monophosphatase [Acidobacteriota bacterium]MDT7779983.1 monophosphatase [Acidobacteriota bacterium]